MALLSMVPYGVAVAVLAVETRSFGHRRANAERRDRSSYALLIGAFALCSWAAFVFPTRGPHLEAAELGEWALAVGVLVAASGIAVRLWAISVLGEYFTRTVEVSSSQRVVESGPYRLIRHPSYSGILLEMIGMGLSLRNLVSLGILVLGCSIAIAYRIGVEERALRAALGEAYVAYSARTKRLIPFVL